MDSRTAKRLVLPAALVVSTYVSATSCNFGPNRDCEDIAIRKKCDATEGCGWSEDFDECVSTCFTYQTQAECEAVERCFWEPGGGSGPESDTGGSETGEDGSCHAPFS